MWAKLIFPVFIHTFLEKKKNHLFYLILHKYFIYIFKVTNECILRPVLEVNNLAFINEEWEVSKLVGEITSGWWHGEYYVEVALYAFYAFYAFYALYALYTLYINVVNILFGRFFANFEALRLAWHEDFFLVLLIV